MGHRLVTLALSIPESVKTRGGRLKHTLKESVRGLIPDPLIDRPKQGFAVPIHEWLLVRLGDQAQQAIRGLTDHTGFSSIGRPSNTCSNAATANRSGRYSILRCGGGITSVRKRVSSIANKS